MRTPNGGYYTKGEDGQINENLHVMHAGYTTCSFHFRMRFSQYVRFCPLSYTRVPPDKSNIHTGHSKQM